MSTPLDTFDIRCEYDVPRYVDLNMLDEDDSYELRAPSSSGQYFNHEEWTPGADLNRKHSTTGGVRV
jgi:hypothetical protein